MSLTLLVSQEKWQEFDQAWSELMKSSGPVDELLRPQCLLARRSAGAVCRPCASSRSSARTSPAEAAAFLALPFRRRH